MENDLFTTLITFTYLHESSVLRSRLESEGIECFIKDELTTQVNPFYSNALGGIRLQVRQSDIPIAMAILKDSSYFDTVQKPMRPFYLKLEEITQNWIYQHPATGIQTHFNYFT